MPEQPDGPRDSEEVVDDLEEKHVHQPDGEKAGAAPDVKAPESEQSESEPSEASSTSAASEPPD